MNDRDKELLAQFHHTISEQLNSRLSESPKFFGLLVIVATGYGFVLSECRLHKLFIPATLLALSATLWASGYLAALGYAFRFLQNTQHCIEHAFRWNIYTPRPAKDNPTGKPPWPTEKFSDSYWLLPGIYHAHAFGFAVFLGIIGVAFGFYAWFFWQSCLQRCLVIVIGSLTMGLGLVWIRAWNRHYLKKYNDKWRDPETVEVLVAAPESPE
ncbi:MAG: hypothetical protein WCE63_02735 [Acidobacteriaceae bacterium]